MPVPLKNMSLREFFRDPPRSLRDVHRELETVADIVEELLVVVEELMRKQRGKGGPHADAVESPERRHARRR
jgi:hypothetical protein